MSGGQFDLTMSNLPLRAFREIPDSRPDAKSITGIVKEKGKISGYRLSDGQILTKDQGIRMAREGGIVGVGISARKGSEYLKSLPDASDDNNLSNLPTIKQ
ncbi:MAG: DUF3892 domain-containing protein [Oscillospiraceae bacterium]|nr:DUF3892 domain-containing protein [Oscillospiraceae bacterium]